MNNGGCALPSQVHNQNAFPGILRRIFSHSEEDVLTCMYAHQS